MASEIPNIYESALFAKLKGRELIERRTFVNIRGRENKGIYSIWTEVKTEVHFQTLTINFARNYRDRTHLKQLLLSHAWHQFRALGPVWKRTLLNNK